MTNEHNNAAQTDWRELCRRLYVELWHCDKQMTSGARPKWKQGPAVRDVLRDANLALEATPAAAPAPASSQDEPFGYFRAEPFGWTDCAADEEGAIALYERPAAPAVPQGWTDADSDAARLALELECLLLDTETLSVVSKWWASANEALELHRQRLATPAAPSQEPMRSLTVPDDLPGMWDHADLSGGETDAAPSQPVTLTDSTLADIQDRLVSISGYVADQDDMAAQAILKETLKIIAALREKEGA